MRQALSSIVQQKKEGKKRMSIATVYVHSAKFTTIQWIGYFQISKTIQALPFHFVLHLIYIYAVTFLSLLLSLLFFLLIFNTIPNAQPQWKFFSRKKKQIGNCLHSFCTIHFFLIFSLSNSNEKRIHWHGERAYIQVHGRLLLEC